MAKSTFLWRLLVKVVMTTLFVVTVLMLQKETVTALITAIPLWNVTTNLTGTNTCSLGIDDSRKEEIRFDASPFQTCRVQLIASNGSVALFKKTSRYGFVCRTVWMPGTMYFEADEPCFTLSLDRKFLLLLQGYSHINNSISIVDTPVNISAPTCLEDSNAEEQHALQVGETDHCQTKIYNHLIFGHLSPDYTCSFTFPVNCNITLCNQEAKFQCYANSFHSTNKTLIVYPPGIITLDLTRQSIV